jgi:hypothetical protein
VIKKDNNEYISEKQFKETVTEQQEINEALKRGERVEVDGHTYEPLRKLDE